ncbi:MAG: ABC transporter substrate-binding protein [Actinomycetota bacterium]|nr:ABC transporter substrate-binding protein [Actinomycetota bacterium]
MRRFLWVLLAALVVVEPKSSIGVDGASGRRAGNVVARLGGPTAGSGGVLRLGVTALATLDPAKARTIDQQLVADQLFDSLTALDPGSQAAVPALAARWEASLDQRQWDFHLRPGALFSDGRPITAADVKYSLERVARPGSGSPASDLLQPVTGYVALRQGAPELAGVTAPALDVVRISLEQPWSVFPSVLASPVFGVLPEPAVEAPPPALAFPERPVGSGPFKLRDRRRGMLSLVPSPRSTARLAGIEVTEFDTVASAYAAFTAGRLDWAQVPPDEIDAAARRYGRDAFSPYVAQLFYGFNLENPKFADPRFREALVRAIDRRAVVAAVYQGAVRPLDGIVLEGLAEFQAKACGRCGHDPARARALLAELFPGTGPRDIALDFDADPSQEALANAIQAGLREVGVTVTIRPRPPDEYDEFVVSGQQELFRLGWIAAYPSADAFLAPMFSSASPNNLTRFASPAVDEQLRRARAEPDAARRTELYREAERAILDDVPVIPIAQFRLHAVVSKRVRNLRANALGSFDASTVTVAGRR